MIIPLNYHKKKLSVKYLLKNFITFYWCACVHTTCVSMHAHAHSHVYIHEKAEDSWGELVLSFLQLCEL